MLDEFNVPLEDFASYDTADIPMGDYDYGNYSIPDLVTPDAPYQDYSSNVDFESPVSDIGATDYSNIDTSSFATPEAPYQEEGIDFSKVPEKAGEYLQRALKSIGAVDEKGKIGKNALPLLALAKSAYASRQAGKEAAGLKNQLLEAAGPTKGISEQLLSQYQSGQINPAAKAQIDQATAAAIAQIKQRYAQMGRNPETDSAAQNEIAMAQQRSLQLTEQARQGILSQGLQAAGMAQGPIRNAVMAQYNANRENEQSMYQLLAALARMQSREQSAPQQQPERE